MRYTDLFEGQNTKCIVVDVQPAYTASIPWIPNMMHWLNQQGPVLMFVNAENDGLTDDTVDEIRYYWMESGYDQSRWNQTEIVDKGYGYFRSWMDQGVSDRAIIKTIRQMYAQKITDSRELFEGEGSESYIDDLENFLGPDFEDWMVDDGITVEWTSVARLKRYNGAYLMGGGRNECLKEVTLLMNAFNIKYKLVNNFIYG